ncbi:unnamed protein product [Closterium sp. Yama58-4]|nr:unnamed protein product [Closterium sp. Yama58-4]
MVHYVDVHLPWSHSLCACCLPRMLRPAPLVAFRISSLASLRKHLQQPVVRSMPPFRLANNPTPPILAYSATVPLSAPPRRFPGYTSSAAAPSLAQQYRWKVDAAPVVAAEGMMLEWLAEPRVGLLLDLQAIRRQLAEIMQINELAAARREANAARGASAAAAAAAAASAAAAPYPRALWWCCWQCSRCWTLYRRAVSIAAFIVLVAKFPRFVMLWRAHLRSPEVVFSMMAFQFGAGRQGQGDCLASLLLQGGLAGEQYRCCCSQCGEGESTEGRASEGALGTQPVSSSNGGMVISGAGPTDFALKCGTLFCQPLFARSAALIFSDCAGSRHKESVEDAAVEEADRGKRAVDSEAPATAPAAPAAAGSGTASGSGAAGSAGLVPVNSNTVVALFTYRVTCLLRWVRLYGFKVNPEDACAQHDRKNPGPSLPHPIHELPNLMIRFGAMPKPAAAAGLEGSVTTGWKEFPEGNRAAVAKNEKDPGEFIGVKTFRVGVFRDDRELDKEEMKREYNVRELNMPQPGASSSASPSSMGTLEDNTSGPFFPTLGHRVEEFLKRFAPARLAREGRNGPLARAITSWAGSLDLEDRAWSALALGPFAMGKIKPILRSRIQVEIFIEMIAGSISPGPACTRCRHCIRRKFLGTLGVAPVPAVVPDSLVAPLLEGVMEEHRLQFLFFGIRLIGEEGEVGNILEPVGQDGVGQEGGVGWQGVREGDEEWRMWEEVDSWRRAAIMAWPAVEGRGEAGVDGGEGMEESCAGMERALREEKAVADARKQALIQTVIVAGGAGAAGAHGGEGGGGGEERGKAVASYLEPWPGGVNPLACLREMLLGETSYCPQAKLDAVSAADGKGGPRGCASLRAGCAFGEHQPCES